MNITKLFFSFSIIIIIAVSGSIFTIIKMQELTINTQKMYTHPFKVSNSVANIQTSIITMHRNMKDVVLTTDTLEMIKIIESIQQEESKVYDYFKIIYDNYLGDKKDIDTLYDAFKSWKIIREEVIALVNDNKLKEAINITKDKGKKHIDNLYLQIDVLKNYALNKADEFYNLSVKDSGIDKVIIIFILSIIISGNIIIYIINSLLKINRFNNKQLHLIDQNILTVTVDLNKKVLKISNALCRSLKIKQKDIINEKTPFFFTNESQFLEFESIIYSAKEYKGEVYIQVDDIKTWYFIEIFPELDQNFKLDSFSLFLTNINDKKRIEEVSITDTLTGLYNRNYFEMIFDKEVKRSKRDAKALSMIMIDIDFFKQFNDTYGHQEGDYALKAVAHVLAANTKRSCDYVFRVGGEEFVILTYQKNYDMLKFFVKNLLEAIESLKISHKENSVSAYLTASAGVIEFEKSHLLNTDDMYNEVDKLLYKAKKSGRNTFEGMVIS